MNVKISLIALGAACSVVLLASPNAFAESTKTEQKKPKQVVVTVKAGDTLSSIAKKHKTTYVRIYNANKWIQNPDIIDVGQKVRIPASKEKLKNRIATQPAAVATSQPTVTYVATQPTYTYSYPTQAVSYSGGSVAGNTYGWGQCTWYAKNRRADLPNSLGNGGSWTGNAAARGYATGNVPRPGAIAEIPGHVMYVESVNKNGTVNISEMNFNGGVGVVNHRTIPASSATYIY